MLLHPVVVTATGNWPQDLVARLLPRWSQRLRVASRVLEFAKGPPSVGWAHAIRTLLQEQRIGELVREGFQVAPTIDVVWLAQSHAPELEAELEDLESQRDGPLFSGREVRIHVLLLLPSVFPIGQGEPARAQANIERLRPDRAAYPPLRVWPISLRNRADLHLRDANELAPLVQHFVEALICTDLPVQPTLGRDWAGVGLCRMAVARPARESVAARLASVLIKKSLAPVVVPSLPACPVHPASIQAVDPPPRPERRSCHELPEWKVANPWQEFRESVREQYRRSVAQTVSHTERLLGNEAVEHALQSGVPAVRALRKRLEQELQTAQAQLNEATAPFDAAFQVQGLRAYLESIREAANRDDSTLLGWGREQIENVDRALESCDIEAFLQRDPEAQEAEEKIQEAQSHFRRIDQEWKRTLAPPEDAQQPAAAGQRGTLRRWFDRGAKWVWETLRDLFLPPTVAENDEDAERRKQLCERAWKQVQSAYDAGSKVTDRSTYWLERWAEFRLRRAYRDALVRAIERCETTERLAKQLREAAVRRQSPGLTLQFHVSEPTLQRALHEGAENLIRDGALRALNKDQLPSLKRRIAQEAGRLAAQVKTAPLSELVDPDSWRAALEIAAPRAMIAHRPDQLAFTCVIGHASPPPGLGVQYQLPHWLTEDTEALVFRFVCPVLPEDLLPEEPRIDGIRVEPLMPRTAVGGEASIRQRDSLRPNPLLEQAFDE